MSLEAINGALNVADEALGGAPIETASAQAGNCALKTEISDLETLISRVQAGSSATTELLESAYKTGESAQSAGNALASLNSSGTPVSTAENHIYNMGVCSGHASQRAGEMEQGVTEAVSHLTAALEGLKAFGVQAKEYKGNIDKAGEYKDNAKAKIDEYRQRINA